MKLNKHPKIEIFFLIGIFFFSLVGASSYVNSNPNYGLFNSYVQGNSFNSESCNAGQDFIIQIAPFGCTPAVVRSDLLEEQNVPIFCQLAATKINPLIDVDAIESISFSGDYPKEVSGIGFHPAQAALGTSEDLNSPVLNNIGYAVIVLKQNKNESSMPDFVSGNLTAKISYDIKNAFGIGKASFYLPEINAEEWDAKKNQYSFWDGLGYLRAESIDENSARIIVSDDIRQISGVNLNRGETSGKISIPGLDCLANLQLRLDNLVAPDTRAKLDINGEVVETIEGETFLDGNCRITGIDKMGLAQKVGIRCKTDEGIKSFDLRKSPRVKLDFEGANPEGYLVGERMPFSDDPNKDVYLAYVGTIGDSGRKEDLYARFVQVPKDKFGKDFLTDNVLSEAARYDKDAFDSQIGGTFAKTALGTLKTLTKLSERFARYTFSGTEISNIVLYGETDSIVDTILIEGKIPSDWHTNSVYGTQVYLTGFADGVDSNLRNDAKENYENAMADYDKVLNSFPNEPCDKITCGEEALYKKIILAFKSGQKLTASALCDELNSNYPNSKKNLEEYCNNKLELSNAGISSQEIVINGVVKRIFFEGLYEPSLEEYSVDISISNAQEDCTGGILRKNGQTCFSDNEFITLKELHQDYALFDVSSVDEGDFKNVAWKTSYLRIDLHDMKVIGKNNYQIRINEINLKNVAKVSVLPNVDNAGTNATFSFKVGIEKRAIQLSPEQIKDKINNLDKSIKDWQSNSDNLGNIVQGLKGVCLATGAYLTVKNFISNTGGESIARQEVMTSSGGWNQKCQELVNQKQYDSLEKCFIGESDTIDKDVDNYYSSLTQQNSEIKTIESGCDSTTFLTEVHINTDCFKEKYSPIVKEELSKNLDGNQEIDVGGEKVKISKILEGVNASSVSVEQLRSLQLNSRVDSEMAKKQLEVDLKDIYLNTKEEVERSSFEKEAQGIKGAYVDSYGSKDSVQGIYRGSTAVANNKAGIPEGTPVQMITFDNKEYYLELKESRNNEYSINNIYDSSWNLLTEDNTAPNYDPNVGEIKKVLGRGLKKYDSSSYENEFKSVSGETGIVAKFYETEPYKGLPALVPFDLKKGWYAATKQTLSVFGGIKSYDESGRVTSVWICNVGENGIAEFKSGIGDDECEQVNLGTGQSYNQFPGLSASESTKLVTCAVKAIEDASNYDSGNSIRISTTCGGNVNVKVGSPAVDVPEIQCTDLMSPKECLLLFNVCDPVICPSSRCDLGGAYPVKDVIQSGIIGSIALCLPNAKEGIYVPVCLTGIKAGIDGYLSVVKAHRDCLQESLDTGETVGVCDEIYSINLCEFFWRQGLPLSKLILPKLVEVILGQNVKGGGEYLGVADAWTNAEKSVNYFTQYYAANSFEAFKARTTEDVGGEVCKSYVSGVYPSGGNLLDSLTEPDSPPQYHGRFDEIEFTTATVPAISQYKVYYHIYAGKDSGAYYQVYLTEGEESSFYQDSSYRRIVGSGYITKGDYASETVDFTAPAGYKKMCIRVNNEEECGFKQVSTSYAVNYVEDKYMEEQASQTDITSESTCISGTASAYSLVSPNLQEGVSEVIDPAIYNRGIIRICATANPGKGTDESRWSVVGYCDDTDIKCWIDTNSVSNVIKDLNIENRTLSELEKNSLNVLEEEGVYEKEEVVKELITEKEKLMKEEKYSEVIDLVNRVLEKVFLNGQKVILLLNRGDAYSNLIVLTPASTGSQTTTDSSTTGITETNLGEGFSCEPYLNFIRSAATKYGTDYNLLLAIAVQESNCNPNAVSSKGAVGLMQISSWEDCAQLGIKSKDDVTNNIEDNIFCGAFILSQKYSQFKNGVKSSSIYSSDSDFRILVDKCIGEYSKYETYRGWEAALRAYNGWGCDSGADTSYVENVITKSESLKKNGYVAPSNANAGTSTETSSNGAVPEHVISFYQNTEGENKNIIVLSVYSNPSCSSIEYKIKLKRNLFGADILFPDSTREEGTSKENHLEFDLNNLVGDVDSGNSFDYYAEVYCLDENGDALWYNESEVVNLNLYN